MIGIVGAGAFGTALGVTLARDGNTVTLWDHNVERAARANAERTSHAIANLRLPDALRVTSDIDHLVDADVILLCTPAQTLRQVLQDHAVLRMARYLVACCKGIDAESLTGPVGTIAGAAPDATPAILTGPSFATDIAKGLPTALTLACADETAGEYLQQRLHSATVRLYRTTDVTGAELGGALKNVIAIGAGVCIGAGLGDSARAALMTRGFAELSRFAQSQGAEVATLSGLSGFGDLVLTCTSPQSRNYRFGEALGRGDTFNGDTTVEGVKTAQAIARLAQNRGIDMPVCANIAALCSGDIDTEKALQTLLARPLKEE
ncbi:MAG: NAD(P)H-dependent glycerol-3-phosphate dehydrogenase [Paracoccaceae bacterium]